MKILKAIAKAIGLLVGLVVVAVVSFVAIAKSADFEPVELSKSVDEVTVLHHKGFNQCEGGRLRQNDYGMWEILTEGPTERRGLAYAALFRKQVQNQENVFLKQVQRVVQSESYARFLKLFLDFYNRNLNENIPLENRIEISAIAQSCNDEYNMLGGAYERQLHYHAAHDIGHVMQGYMLVGCTSFATRGSDSENGGLVVGRNFDFYFGDDFARQKVVSFVRPEEGIAFASITWPGMTGVVSGMNVEGLTVTLNAAQGPLPLSARTPITIVARQILQYASTIDEAVEIANQYETFVSESILVASAKDNRAVVIEKTPEKTAVYESATDHLSCTNHYQSEAFANDSDNLDNIGRTDSYDRKMRLDELIDSLAPLTPQKAVDILRDRKGLNNTDIGIGNEKSINQFLAHHSVVFEPDSLLMWVSTSPWQAGDFLCYDLRKIFDTQIDFGQEIYSACRNIESDKEMILSDIVTKFRYDAAVQHITTILNKEQPVPDFLQRNLERLNPNLYRTHLILSDCYMAEDNKDMAISELQRALDCVLPTVSVRESIEARLNQLREEAQ